MNRLLPSLRHRAPILLTTTLAVLGLLVGCAGTATAPSRDGWHTVTLPGKNATQYTAAAHSGRPAVRARAERSASMWRRNFASPLQAPAEVSFSWWVPALNPLASVADVDREDATARVLFAFGGDSSKLPQRTRMMFELAEALSGERPPFATLMYVYDPVLPVGSVIVNPRSDRIRKIVVDSGQAGLAQWRDHRRNLAADFRRAFGEEPGPLLAVALMTDTDNTSATAEAWYGPVELH